MAHACRVPSLRPLRPQAGQQTCLLARLWPQKTEGRRGLIGAIRPRQASSGGCPRTNRLAGQILPAQSDTIDSTDCLGRLSVLARPVPEAARVPATPPSSMIGGVEGRGLDCGNRGSAAISAAADSAGVQGPVSEGGSARPRHGTDVLLRAVAPQRTGAAAQAAVRGFRSLLRIFILACQKRPKKEFKRYPIVNRNSTLFAEIGLGRAGQACQIGQDTSQYFA